MKKHRIDENYKFFNRNLFLKFCSFLLYIIVFIVGPIMTIFTYNVRLKGRKNLKGIRGGAIVAPTHNITLDCLITGTQVCAFHKIPYYVTLEKNIFIPVAGFLIRLLRGLPNPQNLVAKKNFLTSVQTLLYLNKWIVIYPEGRLTAYKNELEPFKRGAFKLSVDTNVPIIPVVYTYRKPRGIFAFRKRPFVTGYIMPPLYADYSLKTKQEQVEELRNRCESQMKKLFYEKNELYYTPKH